MNRIEKKSLVSLLKDNFTNYSSFAVVHYRGMSDKQLYNFRVNLRKKGCVMKIAKNKLVNVAIKETPISQISQYLKGPVAIIYSQDPVSLSKTIFDTSKEVDSLKPQFAYFDNSLIELEKMEYLAKLGSLEDVRSSFIYTLTGVHSSIISLFDNYLKKLS